MLLVRLIRHELTLSASLGRWIVRRPHGGAEGDVAVAYAGGRSIVVFALLFVSIVETVALALLIPSPLAHRILLVLDLWGIFFVVAFQAACIVRPHVVGSDGS